MIADSGEVYLIDLDAAKIMVKGQYQDTQLIGTQGFAAPEQYGFGASTVQTDIYGVGKLMLTMLTGSPDSKVPDSVKAKSIIEKCLNIDPKDRYQTAHELKSALNLLPRRKMITGLCIGLASVLSVFIIIVAAKAYVLSKANSQNNQSSFGTSDAVSVPVLSTDNAIGVYSGDYDEKLVLADNGLAYYYCDTLTYSEPECRWYEENGKIVITLEKLRCDIYATVSKNDYSKLYFKSDSANWSTEKFKKISSDYSSYILDPPPSASSFIDVLSNGDMEFSIGSLQFDIPKTFLDYGDEFQSYDRKYFVDFDVSEGFVAGCVFYEEETNVAFSTSLDFDESNPLSFVSSFLDEASVGDSEEKTVAGMPATAYRIKGKTGSNFGELKGYLQEGTLIIVHDVETNESIYIMMIQTPGQETDDTLLFEKIIQGAVHI